MLTQEQSDIVDAVMSKKDGIISVNAIAGAGKTSTVNAIVRTIKPKNGFYTAFNKAIVKDSARKFGDVIECKTVHSLAYRYLMPKMEIKDMSYDDITEDIDIDDKCVIRDTINDFFLSRYTDFHKFIQTQDENIRQYEQLCVKYISMMNDGKINPSFNFMLKALHCDLANGDTNIQKDMLILDEAQDVSGVTYEIFRLIDSPKKIVLGDKYQNIYSFMNTINIFDVIENDTKMRLTKSFRCNTDIAMKIEDYGKQHLEDSFVFKGNENVEERKVTNVIITRTNSGLISYMYDFISRGVEFGTVRSINEIFACPIAIFTASRGKEVYDSRYKFLEREYRKLKTKLQHVTYREFSNHICKTIDNDREIMSAISLLNILRGKNINIYNLKEQAIQMNNDMNNIIATAHSFKGLEADRVFIGDDMNNALYDAINGNSDNPMEELNLYYVALSRARNIIENDNFNISKDN